MDRWRLDGAGAVRGRGAAHVHMAGVAGRGMAGLAQMLVQRGVVVTGSEPSPGPAVDRLHALGVRVQVHTGEPPRLGPRSARWLIQGAETETGRSRLDRLVAARRGRCVRTPAECLGALMRRGIGLAVTGGRTASVAAAMIGWTLTRAGLDPTLVLGMSAPQLGGWGRHGGGRHVVVEAVPGEDWVRLAPRLAVLLEDEAASGEGPRVGALRELVESMPDEGRVLAQAGHPTAEAALRGSCGAVEWLALDRAADWWGAD